MKTNKELINNHFNELPKDILVDITSHLDNFSQYNLLVLNKENNVFFKPVVLKNQFIKALYEKNWIKLKKIASLQPNVLNETSNYLASLLLNLVAQGNQEDAKELVILFPAVLTKSTNVTDLSGRTFYNITALQYLMWSLDVRYMVSMMIDAIPVDDEESKQILLHLKLQFETHEKEGIRYSLDNQTIHEKHFNIMPYVNCVNHYLIHHKQMTPDERMIHWSDINKHQLQFPVHMSQHVCEPNIPLSPIPDFKKETFHRCLEITVFSNSLNMRWYSEEHFSALDKNKLCVIRGTRADWKPLAMGVNIIYRPDYYLQMANNDALALKALYESRLEDYCNIKTLIEDLINKEPTLDYHP